MDSPALLELAHLKMDGQMMKLVLNGSKKYLFCKPQSGIIVPLNKSKPMRVRMQLLMKRSNYHQSCLSMMGMAHIPFWTGSPLPVQTTSSSTIFLLTRHIGYNPLMLAALVLFKLLGSIDVMRFLMKCESQWK